MTPSRNHLIDKLPEKERRKLLVRCECVPLVLSDVLSEPGIPAKFVYFPIEGFISLVARIEGHPGLEVGMIGNEGMLGAHVALGVLDSPLHSLVQGEGTAWRMTARHFRAELAGSTALRQALNRYLYVLMSQLASSAACTRFHLIGPRLARWLLMSQDRAHAEQFHVTHEFLAFMLGVRRVGVTAAAMALQRSGLITYHRGELHVVNRPGLEAAACSCYSTDISAYAKALG